MISAERLRIFCLFAAALCFYGCGTSGSIPAKDAAEAWYNLGNAYTELGRNSDAVNAYTKAKQLDPGLLSAGYNLARVYLALGKYDECMDQLDLLLEEDPVNREVLETAAWVHHLQGDDSSALGIYERVLSDFSGSRNSLYNSALILSANRDYEEALKRFMQVFELYPEEESVVFQIASLEASLDNPESAVIWLDKRLAAAPDDFEALELAGDMYVRIKNYADALAAYRKMLSSTAISDASESSGISSEISKEVEGRVSFKIGELLLVNVEDVDRGVEALRRSVQAGWYDKDAFERLLSHSDAEWYQTVSEILQIAENPAGDSEILPAE